MKSMEEMIKAAQAAAETIQKQMTETQSKLDSLEVEGVSGGGLVKIRASAKGRVIGVAINDPGAVLDKIREEADEIEAALDRGDKAEIASETGDLMFALVNLARHVDADPESALRGTNAKFERRFAYIERALAAKGRTLEQASLSEMDALWNEAKEKEKPASRTPPSS